MKRFFVAAVLVLSFSSVASADGQFFYYDNYGYMRSSNLFSGGAVKYLNIAPQPYSRFNPYYAPVYVPIYGLGYGSGYGSGYYNQCAPMYQPGYMPTWNPGYRW